MRVALAIERFDAQGGGAERSLCQIASELARRGHEITIIAGSVFERPGMPDVAYDCLYQSKQNFALSSLALMRWVRRRMTEGAFDTSLSVTTAIPAAVLQPRGGTVRETLLRNIALRRTVPRRLLKRLAIATSPKQQALLRLERRTLGDPLVRRIVAVSRYVQEQLVQHYGIGSDRVEVIPNAAEMPAVTAADRHAWRHEIRAGLRIDDRAIVYLFAAHNPRLKGAEALLAAAREVTMIRPDAVIIFAGAMRYADQRLAERMGVRDHVRFVGATNAMERLYAATDVTVLPTYYDPSSKVVIESLMMGVPAITTRYNGASDLVVGPDHEPRGVVLEDPGNTSALAEAMLLLADSDTRQACAEATAGTSEQLAMSVHVDRLESVLQRTADGRQA